jgi:hypothetical protein
MYARKLERSNDIQKEAEKKSNVAVEDEAMKWLVGVLEGIGFEVRVLPEFRRADAAVRRPSWHEGMWLPFQLKSDGVCSKGRGGFIHCLGYSDMLFVCIKSRLASSGDIFRSAWVCNGDAVKNTSLHESVHGVLSPEGSNIPLLSSNAAGIAAGLEDAINTAVPKLRRSWESIWVEVERETQRNEIALMLSLRIAKYNVHIPTGNQTAIDCFIDTLKATQVKTYCILRGGANAKHKVKGHGNRPYGILNYIKTLLEAAIVESGGRYYILFAYQPDYALLENGVIQHNGYRNLPPSPGKKSINPPLGIFHVWLKGKEREKGVYDTCKWLEEPAFGFRRPVEITRKAAKKVGLPFEWVEEAAQNARSPSSFPTEAQLCDLDERVAKSESKLMPEEPARQADVYCAMAIAELGRRTTAAETTATVGAPRGPAET